MKTQKHKNLYRRIHNLELMLTQLIVILEEGEKLNEETAIKLLKQFSLKSNLLYLKNGELDIKHPNFVQVDKET